MDFPSEIGYTEEKKVAARHSYFPVQLFLIMAVSCYAFSHFGYFPLRIWYFPSFTEELLSCVVHFYVRKKIYIIHKNMVTLHMCVCMHMYAYMHNYIYIIVLYVCIKKRIIILQI